MLGDCLGAFAVVCLSRVPQSRRGDLPDHDMAGHRLVTDQILRQLWCRQGKAAVLGLTNFEHVRQDKVWCGAANLISQTYRQ